MQNEMKGFVQKEEHGISLLHFPFLLFDRDKSYKPYEREDKEKF